MGKIIAISLVFLFLMASCLIVTKPVFGASAVGDSWVEKAPIPASRSGYQAAVVNGMIYLIGASYHYDSSTHSTTVSSSNLAYDPSTDRWSSIAPMLTPRMSFAIAVYESKIYVFGGLKISESNGPSRTSSSVNEVYNPSTNTWTTAASMPTGTRQMQANTANGKIYVIGGMIGNVGANIVVNTTQIYDPTGDSWSTGASMPYPVTSAASAVLDNKIYLISGVDDYLFSQQDPDAKFVRFNQVYDSETDSWSLASAIPVLALGGGAGATTGIAGPKRIYVMGGMLPGKYPGEGLNQNYAYDPSTNSWSSAAPLPAASLNPVVAVVNDLFYVIGGGNGKTAFATNWQYTPIGYGTAASYVLEHTPPEISLLSPANQTYNDSSVPLVFTVNKPLTWAYYRLDGQQNITIIGNDTLTNMTNGLHDVTAYANDSFGNIGASETITFNISKPEPPPPPEPFPTVPVAAVFVAVIALVAAGLLVYLKRRKLRVANSDSFSQGNQTSHS